MRNPGLTFVAVAILALGIGANVTMFSFVNTYLLSPLPFDDQDRLVAVQRLDKQSGDFFCVHFPNFLDWQEKNQSFETLACYLDRSATLNGPGTPEKLKVIFATSELLPMLGIQPVVGRFFEAEDDQPQAQMTALLSYGLWQRRFGANPDVVGQSIEIDGYSTTIIGVLPAYFTFPPWSQDQGELWQPLKPWIEMPDNRWFMDRGSSGSTFAIGKLKSGVALPQAHADMNLIARQLEEQYPDTNLDRGVYLARFQDHMVHEFKPVILLLTAAVAFVLLIVCTNVANLLLIRSTTRMQEFSVRSALGAGRWHIIRNIVCESLVLVSLGGFAGILLALLGEDMLLAILPEHLRPASMSIIGISGQSLLLIFGILSTTIVISSLASVLHMSRIDLAGQIRSQSRSSTTNNRANRLRDTLVVAEIALAMVLLVGAGLMLSSFVHYINTDPGYNPERVISMRLALPEKTERRNAFCTQLLQQVKALPGVDHVGLSSSLLHKHSNTQSYTVEGAPPAEPGHKFFVRCFEITPEFFDAMGMRLLQGRQLNEQDMAKFPVNVVVNQAFARRWWPNTNPIGKRISFGGNLWVNVVGVVNDVKYLGADQESPDGLYYAGYRWWLVGHDRTLVVRTQQDPANIVAPIRKIVSALDASVPIYEVQTVREIMNDQSRLRRVITGVLSGFAVVALLLAALGIYGVLAYVVAQRTQEIGIRMALGAKVGDILMLIVKRGLVLTFIGLAVGMVCSFGLMRCLSSMLYRVSAADPATFVIVPLILLAVAMLACIVPARRAAKIDPMEALRYE
jgi:putative ABC transport system permease protein